MEKAVETAAAAAAARKRKILLGGSQLTRSSVPLKTRRLAVESTENSASSGNSTFESVDSDHVVASCCSSNGSSDLAQESSKFVDLKEVEETTSVGGERIESTQSSEVEAESGEHKSSEKMPSDAKLEEFFSSAEKDLQKKMIDKYNYDIVNDQPLEGRYEWILISKRSDKY